MVRAFKIGAISALSISLVFILERRPAFAEDEEVMLDKIVVTPGRSSETLSRTARNVSVITRGQIERSKANSIPELLKSQTGVTVSDLYGNGKSVSVDIGGFGESSPSNLLVLVDGRKVNNIDTTGTDWTQIPVSLIERIEVVRGASSVLYGDNATSGVINIITRAPEEKAFGAKIGIMAGSYATYGEDGEISFAKGPFRGLGLFEQFRTDGYRVNTKMIRNDFSGKLEYKLNDNLRFKLSGANHTDKYGLANGLLDGELNSRDRRSSVTPDNHASSRDYFADFGIDAFLNELGKVEFSLARRKRDTFADFVATSWMTQRNTRTYTSGAKYSLEKKIFGHDNNLICGLDYFDAEQYIDDGGYSGNPDKLTISKRTFGAYLFDELYLTEKLSFNGGWRYENAHYNFEQEAVAQDSDARKYKETAFSASLNYNYRKNSNLYFNFSNSFRFPMTDEVYTSKYTFFGVPGGGLNTSLGPQTAKNYEFGLRHAFNDALDLGVSGYIMKLENEIYFEPTTFLTSNYGHSRHRGVDFNIGLSVFDNIKFFANYAFSQANFEDGVYDKKKIPAVPEHKWSLGGQASFFRYFTFLVSGSYVGERYFISDQLNVLPRMASYFVVDAKFGFEKNNLSVYCKVNNLFNEEYYEYGAANSTRQRKNYYPSPERNFILAGRFKF